MLTQKEKEDMEANNVFKGIDEVKGTKRTEHPDQVEKEAERVEEVEYTNSSGERSKVLTFGGGFLKGVGGLLLSMAIVGMLLFLFLDAALILGFGWIGTGAILAVVGASVLTLGNYAKSGELFPETV